MAENGLRRGLVALVLLISLVAAGTLLAGGALLQDDDGGADGSPENGTDVADNGTIDPANATVDVDRVNVTLEVEPSDDLEDNLTYELAVVGEVAAANDAANDTVECTRELCVVSGELAPDAEGEDLPRYELSGVVTGAAPVEGFTTRVNGTLEGDAVEGLGLGAYNVSAPNTTDGGANDTILRTDGGESEPETSAATIQSGEDSSGDVNEEDSGTGGASAEDAESSDETASDDEESASGGEDEQSSSAAESADSEQDGDTEASVSFDGCSVATVEGDAYGYEAGLRYYVESGLDTSTYDESDVSTPDTVDGNDVISDARTTDVVVESVLVLDEDFGILTQAENPNYEDCVDTIERQHQEWQDEQGS